MRQKIINYRLSRARRVIECSFGMSVHRFRIFRRPLIAKVDSVIKIVKAVVWLHNFVIDKQPTDFNDADMENLKKIRISDNLKENYEENHDPILDSAIEICQKLAEYFYYKGSVPWQWQKVRNVEY